MLGRAISLVSKSIPADNPYENDGDPDTLGEIYAHGFRNGHRIVWDTEHSGARLVTDIGEANVEEVNLLVAGENYGWSVADADDVVKGRVHWITPRSGGYGAVRDICDLILAAQGADQMVLDGILKR